MVQERLNVVIVGGGVAGLQALNALSCKLDLHKHNLILITARPYFTHLAGTIRALVTDEGSIQDRIRIPYNALESAGKDLYRIVIGKVTAIENERDAGGVLVLDGLAEKIRYDVLVLATGRKQSGPLEFPDTLDESDKWVAKWRAKIEKAHDIVLVGGGASGAEMAGEIKDRWPTKRVSIVHRRKQLLDDNYPSALRERIAESLLERGVNLILDDCIDSTYIRGDGTILARKEHAIKADLVIPMRGVRPNTDFLSPASSPSLGEHVLTKHGYLRVQPTLQLREHARIFAVGDIIDWAEHKLGGKCARQVDVLTSNVVALLDGKKVKAEYRDGHDTIIITNGKMGGVGYSSYLGGITCGNWLSTSLKSRSLMTDSTMKKLGFNLS